MNGAKKSIRWKILAGIILLEAGLTLAFVVTISVASQQQVKDTASSHIGAVESLYNALVDGDMKMLSASLESFSNNDSVRELYAKRDRVGLSAYGQTLFANNRERYGITNLVYIDNDGTCFLRMHKPEAFGDVLVQQGLAAARNTDRLATSVEQGQVGFQLRAVAPMYHKGQRIGFAAFGEEMGKFKDIVKNETGNDVFVLVDKKSMVEKDYHNSRKNMGMHDDWDELQDFVLQGDTLGDKAFFVSSVFGQDVRPGQETQFLRTVHRGDRTYAVGAFPMQGTGKSVIGVVMTLSDVTQMVDVHRWSVIYTVLSAVVVMVASILGAMWFLNRMIIKPLTSLSERADQISLGEMGEALKSEREDEIGMITKSFERMRVSLEKSMARLGL
jgi:HAMP domain-containing protein